MSLKSSNKAYTLEDPKLVVEYFSKPAADNGKAEPKKFNTKTFSLPKLDGARLVNIECPAVSLESYSYKYTSSYYGNETYSSGNEYYGFVMTIFDAGGTLIYQAAYPNSLKKAGTDKVPAADKAS